MTPLALILLCLFAGALFRRQLFLVVKWSVWGVLAFLGLRFIGTLEIDGDVWRSIGLGAFGALVAGLACYAFVYNSLVENDRANDHAGVDKKHDARRI